MYIACKKNDKNFIINDILTTFAALYMGTEMKELNG